MTDIGPPLPDDYRLVSAAPFSPKGGDGNDIPLSDGGGPYMRIVYYAPHEGQSLRHTQFVGPFRNAGQADHIVRVIEQLVRERDEARGTATYNREVAVNTVAGWREIAGGDPEGLSEMSRDQLERFAMRMGQMLGLPGPVSFWQRHAFGPMMAPSCLCCGQLPNEVAIQHAELPAIVICRKCRDAATGSHNEPT